MLDKLVVVLKLVGPDLLRQAAAAIETGEDPKAFLKQAERDLVAKGAQKLLDEVLG